MPSWNPFKRRKSAKSTAAADQLDHPSPGLDRGSLEGVHSRQLSPVGERSASHERSLSAQQPQTRMYRMHRRAPFGIHVKYKGPPQRAHSPTVSPVPEHHEPLPSPLAHDEHEMMFADEPLHREQPPLSPVEFQKPTKSRGGFFSIFRRKSKKAKAEGVGFPEGSRALSPVSAKGSGISGRNRLTRKGRGRLESPEPTHPGRATSPPIDKLSIDPYHHEEPHEERLADQPGPRDHPPRVVDLLTSRPTSPGYVSRQIAAPQPRTPYRPASPTFSVGGGETHRQPGITHILQSDPPAAGGQPAYWVYSENGLQAPPRVVSPGNPVITGNYRVSVRHEDGVYETPTFPHPSAGAPDQTAPGAGSGAQVNLKPGDMYQLPSDRNVVFVVDEGIQLQIGNPETGEFVPYDAAYIADKQAQRRTTYEETYYIPAGKIVEFRDENNRLVYRSGAPRSERRVGVIHDLGGGMRGEYMADGSFLIHTDGPPGTVRSGGLLDPSQVRWSTASGQPHGSVRPGAPGSHDGYSRHSPQPSFIQPTIPSDPYGSGSIRHRESGSGEVRTIPGGSGSLRHQSPDPSFIQPSVHSFDPYTRGTYHHDGEGSDDEYPPPQHPSALSIPSPTRSTSRPPSFSLHGELAHLASRFMMKPRKNMMWKPNGPKDYARSAMKWGLAPTMYTAFFCQDSHLFHRDMSPGAREGLYLDRAKGAPTQGGARLTANDVQNDLEYVVPVSVGTPSQTVHLDFDTGSADLWVWSSFLNVSAANRKGHGIYDPRHSTSSQHASGLTWDITYGDGSSARGDVYYETVRFNQVSIHGQAVEVATHLDSTFASEHGSDGLLGLAFPQINTVKPQRQKTPMEHLIEQQLIDYPIFTVSLDKYGDQESFYTFGYIDNSVLPSDSRISYVDIDSRNGFWEFPSSQMRIGQKIVRRPRGNTAIADTGTTLILLDDASLDEIYGRVRGARVDRTGWILPTSSRPANISFASGNRFYTISGEDLKFADAGNGMSFGAIQSRGQNKQDIFGDVFLKRVYAVFDQTPGHPRLGLGQRTLRD